MSEITIDTLVAAINDTPSEYEEQYVRWVSIGYDKKVLNELLYEIKYLKEQNTWPERIHFLEGLLNEHEATHLLNLLQNDPQTSRFALIEKFARQAAMEILILDKYSIATLNTITQLPLADYQLIVKRVIEITSMIQDISSQTQSYASGLAGA